MPRAWLLIALAACFALAIAIPMLIPGATRNHGVAAALTLWIPLSGYSYWRQGERTARRVLVAAVLGLLYAVAIWFLLRTP